MKNTDGQLFGGDIPHLLSVCSMTPRCSTTGCLKLYISLFNIRASTCEKNWILMYRLDTDNVSFVTCSLPLTIFDPSKSLILSWYSADSLDMDVFYSIMNSFVELVLNLFATRCINKDYEQYLNMYVNFNTRCHMSFTEALICISSDGWTVTMNRNSLIDTFRYSVDMNLLATGSNLG